MSKFVNWVNGLPLMKGSQSDDEEEKSSRRTCRATSGSDRGRNSSNTSYASTAGISKPSRASPRLSKASLAMKHRLLQEHCWALMKAAADLHATVELNAPWTASVEQRMGEIYKEIHIASAPGLNTRIAGTTKIQERIWEDNFKDVVQWMHARLGLDLAARNLVIGLSKFCCLNTFHH